MGLIFTLLFEPALVVQAIFVGATCLVASIVVHFTLRSQRPGDFPPGPPTVPILGNLNVIPTTKAFLKQVIPDTYKRSRLLLSDSAPVYRFHQWGKQYGPIIGLKLGPQNMVVLNDYKHVMELFDRRGAIYSSRPTNHIANDIIFSNATHILFLPYGDDWRILRKTIQDILRTTEVDKMLPIQDAESIYTLHCLLRTPNKWYDHIRRYSTAVILASVFGLRGVTFDSPRVKALYHVQDQNTAINELGATPPLDIFPILKSLPDFMSPWRTWARNIRTEYQALLRTLVDESVENSKRPDAPDCFLARMLREQEKSGLDEEHIAHIGTTLMEAGSDTTASMLLSFLLAMATHPAVLKKCQAEVDSVCGVERSPKFEDREQLPYLTAVLNETLRWRPVAAGGIPHTLTQDDCYEGYVFKKGTIFFANAWSIHRTDEFESPEDFNPERFVKDKFGIQDRRTADVADDKRRIHYGFGAGRRVCSGQRLAENSLIINMAKLVWAFDLLAGEGPIDDSVETGYIGGFVICPKEFPLKIKPRSDAHVAVIEMEFQLMKPFLERFKE